MAKMPHGKRRALTRWLAFVLPLAGLLGFSQASHADAVEDFYKSKRMTIIVTSAAGGSYDLYARLLSRHYGRYIPGNPSFIVQNMPGAGGRRGTGFVFSAAPKDGTVLGAVHNFIATVPLFEGSRTEAGFDPRQFNWIGSVTDGISVGLNWHTSPVKSYKEMFEKEMLVGGVGTDTLMVTNAYLFNGLLGTKLKIIAGYLSSGEVDLAMERGEVEGRVDGGWVSVKQAHAERVKDGTIRILFQLGLKKHPELPDVPLALDFARNEDERRILETAFLPYEFGRPYMAAPGVPADRLAALRQSFMATVNDATFRAEAAKGDMEVNPIQPQRLQDLVERAYSLSPSMIERITALQQPPSNMAKVQYKTIRATLIKFEKGRADIDVAGGGRESICIRPDDTKVTIAGTAAEADGIKAGMTCTIAYLGDKTTAASVACD
jgi:tripartite-type tricarboxylate transporter receptor subunit TctC